jgi:hypothetical protein
MSDVVQNYLKLMDDQREAAFSALDGITDPELWRRPVPKEWSLGEILDHNYLLMASAYPIMRLIWNWFNWYGRLHRHRPYRTRIEDVYRNPKFPQWVGFLWTPRYNTRKPVPLDALKTKLCELHGKIRAFYEDKDEDVMGNLYLYDPVFGWCNLIVTLRIGIYHDQLHYDDIFKQVK